MLTGTHGEEGLSGLTDKKYFDRELYEDDCKRKSLKVFFISVFRIFQNVGVGVLARPRKKSDEIPDIMEIQKADLSDDQDCFYNDPDISQMRIQVRSQV